MQKQRGSQTERDLDIHPHSDSGSVSYIPDYRGEREDEDESCL